MPITSTLADLAMIANMAEGIVALRNGLIDVLAGANCKKLIIYPKFGAESWINGRIVDYWSINSFGFSKDSVELEFDVKWERVEDDKKLCKAVDEMFPRLACLDTI